MKSPDEHAYEVLRAVASEVLSVGLDTVPIDPNTPVISEGLCEDDLDVVELTMAAEEIFGVSVDEEDLMHAANTWYGDSRGSSSLPTQAYRELTMGGLFNLLIDAEIDPHQ